MTSRAAAPAAGDTRIAHRLADAELVLVDEHGEPLPHLEVEVSQRQHALEFGCIGFDLLDHAQGIRDRSALGDDWLALFDTATLPFYWGDFEPERGAPATERLRAGAEWFVDRGVRVKGHPLVWHTVMVPWLDEAPLAEVEAVLRARIRREVAGFAGLIDTWDVINEVVIMPEFDNEPSGRMNAITRLARELGRVGMVRLAVEEARAANPAVRLLINDFDLSVRYERLLDDVLEAGIQLDAIGVQTHMHQGFRGEQQLAELAERFGRFGLPVHFTETSLVSGDLMPAEIVDLNDFQPEHWPSTAEGEQRQADELERHYRALAAQPAVESITDWGLTDEGAWLGAPIGVLHADGSRKPAFDRVQGLVRGEWWLAPTRGRSDGEGRVRVHGFAGQYAITAAGCSAEVALTAGSSSSRVTLLP